MVNFFSHFTTKQNLLSRHPRLIIWKILFFWFVAFFILWAVIYPSPTIITVIFFDGIILEMYPLHLILEYKFILWTGSHRINQYIGNCLVNFFGHFTLKLKLSSRHLKKIGFWQFYPLGSDLSLSPALETFFLKFLGYYKSFL